MIISQYNYYILIISPLPLQSFWEKRALMHLNAKCNWGKNGANKQLFAELLSFCFSLLCHGSVQIYANGLFFKVVGIRVCLVREFIL